MMSSFSQVPDSIVMVRPAAFGFNADTAATNAFQHLNDYQENIHSLALKEFDAAVLLMRQAGIDVFILEDSPEPQKPDAIFPNNWFSIHADGKCVLYPMMAENRRHERDVNHIARLQKQFGQLKMIDLSFFEKENKFLEGTGSIVFDHVNRIAYASRSPRTDETVLKELCQQLNYTSLIFDAVDEAGKPIYHTNVIMCIASSFVVICLDAIHQEEDQDRIIDSFNRTNHKIIAISYSQMRSFAGNMLEVKSKAGQHYLLLSQNALNSLLPGQVHEITRHVDVLPVNIPTIEKFGGGGIRCMVAGIHKQ
jgi:hypothetical protein